MSKYEERASILHGAENEIFSLVRDRATPLQWAEWLAAPLEHAASTGNYELVDTLLRAGADGGENWRGSCGKTVLHAAAEGGSGQVVSALIMNGADEIIDVGTPWGERTPLHFAAAGGFQPAAKVLMLAGADVDLYDANEDSPLHLALEGGHVGLAEDLLLRGADHDRRGSNGHYPIHLAVRSGKDEAVLALVQNGATLDCYDAEGETPLRLALRADRLSTVKILLAGGADPNFRVSRSWTPLHLAAELNKPAAIPALVKVGADIDTRAFAGLTPLFMAAFHGSYSAVSALLEQGAKMHLKNKRGWTPLHVACFKGRPDAADLLLRRGANELVRDRLDNDPSDLIPSIVEASAEDRPRLERLYNLLQNAPQDRVWRRRGFFVMCRAFLDRVQLEGKTHDAANRAVDQRQDGRSCRARRAEAKADLGGVKNEGGGEGARNKAGSVMRAGCDAADGFQGLAASFLALKDHDAFRNIIEFL